MSKVEPDCKVTATQAKYIYKKNPSGTEKKRIESKTQIFLLRSTAMIAKANTINGEREIKPEKQNDRKKSS